MTYSNVLKNILYIKAKVCKFAILIRALTHYILPCMPCSHSVILESTHYTEMRSAHFGMLFVERKNMDNWKIKNYNNFVEDFLHIDEKEVKKIKIEASIKEVYYKIKLQKNGTKKERIVFSIDKESMTYNCQNNIKNNFFKNVFLSSCAYGFTKNKSYFDYLNYHTTLGEETYYLRLDIKDFFDSIRVNDVEECLDYYIDENCSKKDRDKIKKLFISITTFNGRFVQGAVTSPDISNLVFRSLDIKIDKYCNKLGVRYSRYADDMLFSSSNQYLHSRRFLTMIKSILSNKGFKINYDKILRQKGKLVINGYVVTDTINPSRKKMKNINKILFSICNEPSITKTIWGGPNYSKLNCICGYRCHLIHLYKYCDDEHRTKLDKTIKRIENVVENYY